MARNAVADIDHRAPLREARALLVIFRQTIGELVEADGDQFARAFGQGLRAFVDLDAGNGAGLLDDVDQRRAVLRLLPDRLVVEDDAGNVFRHRFGGAEHQLAIIAAIVLGRFRRRCVEALLDRAGGFVGGENALAGRDHRFRDLVQICEVHLVSVIRLPGSPAESCKFLHRLRARRKGGRHFALNTSTPGNGLPSIHSRKAPPAVET